jgi:hypothetical protein
MKHSKSFKSMMFASLVLLFLIILLPLQTAAQGEPPQNKKFDDIIKEVAKKYDLEASLIHSIIRTESDYDPHCVSTKGALGLMQLMPETARAYGVGNPFKPRDNIEGGVRYLKDLINLYDRETRRYIEKVMTSYPESLIKETKTKVYVYQDSSGRVVFTNSHYLYSSNKEKNKSNK